MRNRIESPKKIQAEETRKPVRNWMQLEVAPLIAQRLYCRKPLPGSGR